MMNYSKKQTNYITITYLKTIEKILFISVQIEPSKLSEAGMLENELEHLDKMKIQ